MGCAFRLLSVVALAVMIVLLLLMLFAAVGLIVLPYGRYGPWVYGGGVLISFGLSRILDILARELLF